MKKLFISVRSVVLVCAMLCLLSFDLQNDSDNLKNISISPVAGCAGSATGLIAELSVDEAQEFCVERSVTYDLSLGGSTCNVKYCVYMISGGSISTNCLDATYGIRGIPAWQITTGSSGSGLSFVVYCYGYDGDQGYQDSKVFTFNEC